MKLFHRKARDITTPAERAKIDTLVIIGNGFDRWQGLGTSYASFREYYYTHRAAILKKLHAPTYELRSTDGTRAFTYTDVELIYGDPFWPDELDDTFWNHFESSLSDIDGDCINLFFGKTPRDLRRMRKSISTAKKALTEAFCGWISSLAVDTRESGYRFGDNCLFINFNYTDTLQKRFGVDHARICHIHGEASDKTSIIFGHSDHPHTPEPLLKTLGGRFHGLYLIEQLLYETDKHCQENLPFLCLFLATHGVMCEDITDIYVLGQSMSPVDLVYFDFLLRATKIPSPAEKDDVPEMPEDTDDMDELLHRLQYAIDTTGYGREAEDADADAIQRKLAREQQDIHLQYDREIRKLLRRFTAASPAQIPSTPRAKDAAWHIAYHGEKDRQWKEVLMQELGCRRFTLYDSIDRCLEQWKLQP